MKILNEVIPHSEEETLEFARSLGASLPYPSLLTLSGDLGAGKTTFVRGLATTLNASQVSSPTFTYLHLYPGSTPLYHFDLYRLKNPEDFLLAGFADYLNADGICCIEWPERIETLLPSLSPSNWRHIEITCTGATSRHVTVGQMP